METNQLYDAKAGIESLISSGMPYGHLENQIIRIQEPEEAEDPPETLHTTWGIWLHKRDPLHNIDQRYDMEHILRTLRVGDDILHYYHYVPIIGEHNHIHESYEFNFEYDYSNQEFIYNFNQAFDEEDAEDPEATLDFGLDEGSGLAKEGQDEEPHEKEDIFNDEPRTNIDFELDKELVKIFEKTLKLIENKGR